MNGSLGGPILKDGMVIFGARDQGTPPSPAQPIGIYSVPVTGGAIQRIVNYNTPVPGGVENFFSLASLSSPTGNFSYGDGVVGFEGEFGGGSIGNSGIYQSNIAGGQMQPIADSLHGIGDLFPITNFTHVVISQNRAAFIGGNVFGYSTLYSTNLPSSLSNYRELRRVDNPLPGASSNFSFVLPSLRILGNSVFFIALDGTGGASNNRRTLYEIPFSGGQPQKIISNLDSLPGLSSIEQSSISSYDVNGQHVMIRAKAPGSTPEQGLFLYNRANHGFTQILSLNDTIFDRSFGLIAEVQPGALSEDSARAVASIAGSAIFVGPY
ncbi:MAG: hypothetical protein KDD60_12690, partial [Bdellovibrionales bacterium]|nr:hypothetical protein [Bdellovibrionales bacterium]